MTQEQIAKLEALRKKAASDLSEEENAEKTELEALEAKEAGDGGDDPKYTQAYVEKLRSDAAKYRIKAKEHGEKLAQFEGIDPEKYREMLRQIEEAEKKKLEAKGDWDKLRDQLVEAHGKELAAKDQAHQALQAENAKLQDDINKIILKHEVGVHSTVAKAINPELVEMVVMGKVKVDVDDNGNRSIKVLDTDKKDRLDPKTGELFSVPQLINELKQSQQYAHLFEGGTYGAGGKGEYFEGKNISNPWKAESFNLTMQGTILQKDQNLAKRLITEAGKVPASYGL